MCSILEIARSSYYKWLNHKDSRNELENKEILKLIENYHYKYKGILGYRRMTLWINTYDGYHVNPKRVKRLMNVLNIKAVIRAKRSAYAYSKPEAQAENILNRQFSASFPNMKWVTDVSEFKILGTGKKIYLSAILDLYDLSVVAHRISSKNDNQLVLETFKDAFKKYPSARPLVHSDRGYQYTSYAFRNLLHNQDCSQSMSRAGCCIDNGPIENFWGQIKAENYYLNEYKDQSSLIQGINFYIDFYNTERLQSRFSGQTPMEVRLKALENKQPEYYPIPVNKSIQNYWESIKSKQQNKSELINLM